MSNDPPASVWRILLIDDDEDEYCIARSNLRRIEVRQVNLDWAPTYEDGIKLIESDTYDAVLVDYDLGSRTGIELIREMTAKGCSVPLILYTGRGSFEVDLEAMRAGATAYWIKSEANPLFFERSIRYAIERKRIEEELDRHLQERSAILDSIQGGFIATDRDFYITYINHTAAKIRDYEPADLIGRNIWEVFPNYRNTLSKENYRKVMKERVPIGFEMPGEHQDKWYSVSVSPSSQGILIHWQDISARKQGEAALHRYELLSENSRDIILYLNLDNGQILEANAAAVKAYGYSREELLQRTIYDLRPPELRESIARQISQANTAGVLFETLHQRKDGSRFPVEVSAQGATIGGKRTVISVIRDVTPRKQVEEAFLDANQTLQEQAEELEVQAEELRQQTEELLAVNEKLRASEEKFSKSFWSSPVAIAISTVNEGRFIEVNDSYTALFGFSREELIGYTSMELGMFPDPKDRKEIVRLFRENGGFRNYEIRLRKKSGEPRDVLFSTEKVEIDGLACMLSLVIDITQRKQVEESLRESEKRFRTMADGTPVIIWVANAQDRIEFINRAYCEFFGVTLEQLQSQGWQPLVHPDDHAQYVEVFIDCLRERKTFHGEARVRRSDGEWRWVESVGQPRFSSSGEFIGFVGSSMDITARKQAEREQMAAIARAEQNQLILDAVIQQMPAGIILTDASGSVAKNNTEMDRIWRRSMQPSENIEAHGYRAFHPDGREYKLDEWPLSRSMKQGETVHAEEMTILRGDGTRGAVYVSSAPILDEKGQVIAGVVIDVDITERKRLEEKLIESERRYRELVQYAPVGIYEVDFRTKRFTSVNDAMCLLTGYSRDDLLQMTPFEILDESGRQLFQERIRRWLAGEELLENVEYRVRAKDGHEILAALNVAFTRDEKGEPLGATVIGYDVTERKRAEALLREQNEAIQEYSKKLEQSNQELESFAFVAAHDLKEPLRKVQMFGSLLLSNYAPCLDEQGRDFILRVKSASERMQRMLDGLLEYSRVTTQGQPLKQIDLSLLIESVLSDLEARLQETGGRVEVGELAQIEGDRMQIRQLFQNLIGNALKFHREGVPPVVKIFQGLGVSDQGLGISDQRTAIGEQERLVAISIQDNGIGFDMNQAGQLFQPFNRLVGKSDYEGSGMGLAICRKIVERHGGSISARSVPGEGSTFIVMLPRN
jgi:PAS domain S-box-containing protein